MKMKFPCEELSKVVIPSIRAILVQELNKTYGKNQMEITALLGLTQPSVSYYLRGERGAKGVEIIKRTSVHQKILDLAAQIVKGDTNEIDIMKLFCSICSELRNAFIEEQNVST
ncbi:MAG: transcriptional regulator [Candidatus Helarchaeota archaeon]